MLRVLGLGVLRVLGVLGVFTSESVGGQMSTEGETGAAERGWEGEQSAARAGLGQRQTVLLCASNTRNSHPTLHTSLAEIVFNNFTQICFASSLSLS